MSLWVEVVNEGVIYCSTLAELSEPRPHTSPTLPGFGADVDMAAPLLVMDAGAVV